MPPPLKAFPLLSFAVCDGSGAAATPSLGRETPCQACVLVLVVFAFLVVVFVVVIVIVIAIVVVVVFVYFLVEVRSVVEEAHRRSCE